MISQSKIFLQGALIALWALVFPVSVFASGFLSAFPTASSTITSGYYTSQKIVIPTLTQVKYGGFFRTGACSTGAIYLYDFDITASSSLDILGSRYLSFTSGASAYDGSCRYELSSPQDIPAGIYWALLTKTTGMVFSGGGSGSNSYIYDQVAPTEWLGANDLSNVSLYFIENEGTTTPDTVIESPSASIITSFSPVLGSTTASTSVYISGEGFNTGEYDTFAIEMIGDSPNTVSKSVAWPISAGYFSVSDVTSYPVGQYWGWAVLRDSSRSATEIRKPMKFRVATTSPDTYFGFGLQVFTPTATSAPILPDCIIGSFDLAKCLYALVIPSMTDVVSLLNTATSTLLARMPFGYFTRLTTILLAPVATSTLPSVILTVPDDLPGAGKTLDLTPWPYLFGEDSLLGSTTLPHSSTTLSSLVLPGWNLLVLFIFAAYVFGRVRGILHPSSTV